MHRSLVVQVYASNHMISTPSPQVAEGPRHPALGVGESGTLLPGSEWMQARLFEQLSASSAMIKI